MNLTSPVNNLSDEALQYLFRAGINTMDVERIDGEDYMSDSSYALSSAVEFTTDAPVSYVYDLNGDGQPMRRTPRLFLRWQTIPLRLCPMRMR